MRDRVESRLKYSLLKRYEGELHTVPADNRDQPMAVHYPSQSRQEEMFGKAFSSADFNGKNVFDIGCGIGHFYEYLINKGVKDFAYYGVDVSKILLDIGRIRYPQLIFDCLFWPFDKDRVNFNADIAVMISTLGAVELELNCDELVWFKKYLIEETMDFVNEAFIIVDYGKVDIYRK